MKNNLTETELLFQKLCKTDGQCVCGRRHEFTMQKLLLHEGALNELPDLIAELGTFEHIVMICDENTYRIAGCAVEQMLKVDTVCLEAEGLHANEAGVAVAEDNMPKQCDLLLAVGSGTVHDITRYIAYLRGIDFVSVPTAASVDGFVSNVAAMTWQGVKKTLAAVSPIAMVADSKILAEAPRKLTASGVGDLIGKYIALFDWKLGHLLTDEYYCPQIVKMEEDALESLVKNIDLIANASPQATESLMYGLVLSGLAMQMAQNSRPASGAEHHISHCIEMEVFNSQNLALHGEKVGVATCIVSDAYHSLTRYSANELGFARKNGVSEAEQMLIFAKLYKQIAEENKAFSLPADIAERIEANWEEIKGLIEEIPTGTQICRLLLRCGGSVSLSDIGLSEELIPKLLRYAPYVRNRFTLLRLMGFFEVPQENFFPEL